MLVCDQLYVSVAVSVCVWYKKRESLAGGLASIRGGFSGLLAGVRSNLDMLHLGSARYGLL